MAILGPTPETARSRSNMARSSRVAKPNSSIASSRTLKSAYTFMRSPTAGAAESVVLLTCNK